MAIQHYTVRDIVDYAVSNKFGMPEFQRSFVWTPTKVMGLVESLFSEYPVGTLLLWRAPREQASPTPKTADASASDVWVVDGQQRTTAFCLLFGRKPYWWQGDEREWNTTRDKCDIRVNPLKSEADFEIPKRAITRDAKYISVRKILNASDDEISRMAEKLNTANPESNAFNILRTLHRVHAIGNREIAAFEEAKDLEDIVEIFVRLNQRGSRVSEGDIVLAQVASLNPNWVNRTLRPFLDQLEDYGFDLEPTLVFRSLIGAVTGATRFKDVKPDFWGDSELSKNWPKVSDAWNRVINGLAEYGILNSDVLPSKNALIPLVTMAVQFGDNFRMGPALGWLLHAICTNRYSRTTDTRLAEDLRNVRDGSGFANAVKKAIDGLYSPTERRLDFASDDNEYFKRSFTDGAVQLMLYLLAYDNEAHDWSSSKERIGFSGTELLRKFNPEWHHIFPRAYLRGKTIDSPDTAANIVVIRKETNLKIGRKAPMDYMEGISDNQLKEQCVPTNREFFALEKFPEFINQRSDALARAANEFLKRLETGDAKQQSQAA